MRPCAGERPNLPRSILLAALLGVLVSLLAPAAAAQESRLSGFLAGIAPSELFPEAGRLGAVEGDPPAAPVYVAGNLVGYVFLNSDVVDATGYSGKPIHVLVAMDLSGRIVGARLVEHSEPIVLIGVDEARVRKFVQAHVGHQVIGPAASAGPGPVGVDAVSGATVTVLVIGDTITRAAMRVARARGLAPAAAGPRIDMAQGGAKDWAALREEGAVARLRLGVDDVERAFAADGRPPPPAAGQQGGRTFIDLHAALVEAPVIGRSLLGPHEYLKLRNEMAPGAHALLVMSRGPYAWRHLADGVFERLAVVQGDDVVALREDWHRRLDEVAPGDAPYFSQVGLFVLPPEVPFDPVAPWHLRLIVERSVGEGQLREFVTYQLPYQVPRRYVLEPPPPPEPAAAAAGAAEAPLWQRIWAERSLDLAILAAGLGFMTVVFFVQDWLVRRQRLQYWVRTVFLAWTLLWLGWWALAQLSVVNVLTLTNSLITGFSWDYFLMDPLLFVLWSAVAAALLFWARGAFCGWLCPFGALQEFLNRAARRLRIPQVAVPWWLHERLWALKYVLFLMLFGVALYELALAERLAEIEPFKTAIVLRFLRDWPFVAYAAALLAIGLFIERFFCRYVCPLGAALAIPARLRMFEWLKRHRECGNPCQRCAQECPVVSIHPDGRINPNECVYCMHCQLLYWDDQKCPAMIQRRLKRERAKALSRR